MRSFADWAGWVDDEENDRRGKYDEKSCRSWNKRNKMDESFSKPWGFDENSKITSQFPDDIHALFETFTKSQWRRNAMDLRISNGIQNV